jgi:hypothetical protein
MILPPEGMIDHCGRSEVPVPGDRDTGALESLEQHRTHSWRHDQRLVPYGFRSQKMKRHRSNGIAIGLRMSFRGCQKLPFISRLRSKVSPNLRSDTVSLKEQPSLIETESGPLARH